MHPKFNRFYGLRYIEKILALSIGERIKKKIFIMKR